MNKFELMEEVAKFQWDEATVVDKLPLATLIQGWILYEYMIYHSATSDMQCASILQKAVYSKAIKFRTAVTAETLMQ